MQKIACFKGKNVSKDKYDIDIEALTDADFAWSPTLNEKQRQILDTAEHLFVEQGYDKTPTAQIAREAGVTERTLFKHFGTKTELFKHIFIPILLRFLAGDQFRQVRSLCEQEYDSYEDFLRIFFKNRIEAQQQHAGKAGLILRELLEDEKFRNKLIGIFSAKVLSPMKALIKRMQKDGKIRSDVHAEVIIRTHIATVISYYLVRGVIGASTPELDLDTEIEQMATLLAKGAANK